MNRKRRVLLVGGQQAGKTIETEYFPTVPFPQMKSALEEPEHLTDEQAQKAQFPVDRYSITRFAVSTGDVHFGIIEGLTVDDAIYALWNAYSTQKRWDCSEPAFCGECGAGFSAPPAANGKPIADQCPYCALEELKREVVIAGAEAQHETRQ